jgi:hypothetical protein
MELGHRNPPYVIPGYSLTGDLLAYRRCGLQYRYYNRGALPPSRPVQQWFGEFIHGVLEEAYRHWSEDGVSLPWNDDEIDKIENEIVKRLAARGLRYRNLSLLRISKARGRLAINLLGPELFPLLARAELPLQAVRVMPDPLRSDLYEVKGIVDVLTSVELRSAPADNRLLRALEAVPEIRSLLEKGRNDSNFSFEVIVDYKGMARPAASDPVFDDLKWQLLTYSWLRGRQPESQPVLAGVLVFINELLPTAEETRTLKRQIATDPPDTDVLPAGEDLEAIENWRGGPVPERSDDFRFERALRVITADQDEIEASLATFDETVEAIEQSVAAESSGVPLTKAWEANPVEQTCAVCDWRSFCPSADSRFRSAPSAP